MDGNFKLRSPFLIAFFLAVCCVWLLPTHNRVAEAASSVSAAGIDQYLRSKGSPLAGYGYAFMGYGKQYNVDPRLIVAIAGAESSFGNNGSCASQRHNAWGYGGGWPNCWTFSSWEGAILQVSADVGKNYLPLKSRIADFSNGHYPSYCVSGCEHWTSNVERFYEEQGGARHTTDLTFTGNTSPACRDSAVFVGQSLYPTVRSGERFQIFFDVRNTGTCTWRATDGYRLVNANGVLLAAPNSIPLSRDVAPGQTIRWTLNMWLPSGYNPSANPMRTAWVVEHNGQQFGPQMYIDVTVDTARTNDALVFRAPSSQLQHSISGRSRACGNSNIISIEVLPLGNGQLRMTMQKCDGTPFAKDGWFYIQHNGERITGRQYYNQDSRSRSVTISGPTQSGNHSYRLELYPENQSYPIWSGVVIVRAQ